MRSPFNVDDLASVRERLEYIRSQLRADSCSWGDMADLQALADHIEPGDLELLEPAGVPENEANLPLPRPSHEWCKQHGEHGRGNCPGMS